MDIWMEWPERRKQKYQHWEIPCQNKTPIRANIFCINIKCKSRTDEDKQEAEHVYDMSFFSGQTG